MVGKAGFGSSLGHVNKQCCKSGLRVSKVLDVLTVLWSHLHFLGISRGEFKMVVVSLRTLLLPFRIPLLTQIVPT